MKRILRTNEEGAVLPMGLLFALFCFGLGYAVFNLAQAVDYREEMQDRADGAAYAAAAVWAERLNDVSHFSQEQFAQLDALTLVEVLMSVPYECNPPEGFDGCEGDRPDPENLARGIPASWPGKGFTTGDYKEEIFQTYPLCAEPDCGDEKSMAIQRARRPGPRYTSTTLGELIDGAWAQVDAQVSGATGGEITARVDKNSHQSPTGNKRFSGQGETPDNAYNLIHCMRWNDVDDHYINTTHVRDVRERANALIAHHGSVVESENASNQADAAAATDAAEDAAETAANSRVPEGSSISAPCSGTVRLTGTCPSCTARITGPNCDGTVTVSNLDFTHSTSVSVYASGVSISAGQSLGTAGVGGSPRSGFPAGPVNAVAPKAAWQLSPRSESDVRNAMEDVWNRMRSEGVCFPALSRNTNRYRFLGVATSVVDVNDRFANNALVTKVGDTDDRATQDTGYEMARAGNFAWAQAGVGVKGNRSNAPERRAQNLMGGNTPSGQWYRVPAHEFGFRMWRPRMVRIEFHRGDENKYGGTAFPGGGAAPGPEEQNVWKKVNDGFAH